MHKVLVYFLVLLMFIVLSLNCNDDNPYLKATKALKIESIQKYVEVRPGAYMFYWLYFADGTSLGADLKPLVIWIQGGPGIAASGVGNFGELGPLNMNMQPRNHTWMKGRNLLLIDHPVGTGFSYVTDKLLLVKTNREMVMDLAKVIKAFFKTHKQFRKTPSFLISQSYGGKLCPRLAFYLDSAIENKRLKMNLKGIGIGSGWVDPKESTLVQPDFLYKMALSELEVKINRYVKPTFSHLVNQSLQWFAMSDQVFLNLIGGFLVPSTSYIEKLLNRNKLKIAVYNGNLDAVTPLAGTSNWVHKLKWYGAEEFRNANRIQIRGENNGFYKTVGKLSFWSVLKSGHWVPEENPVAMEQILNHIMNDD